MQEFLHLFVFDIHSKCATRREYLFVYALLRAADQETNKTPHYIYHRTVLESSWILTLETIQVKYLVAGESKRLLTFMEK